MGQFYRRAEKYLNQLDPGRFIEIGSSRNGDSGSTATISGWAKQYSPSGWLTTVDVDPVNCKFVQDLNLEKVEVINSTGEKYLETFPSHTDYISFIYLDNFDWDWHPEKTEDFVLEQQVRYQELGIEMNNVNSQRAHLAQAQLALKALAPKSIVVCDDTFYVKHWGHFSGKSGSAIPLLLNHGFEIVDTEEYPEYGTILTRGIKL